MTKKYPVALTDTDRRQRRALIAAGAAPARTLTHARARLTADHAPGGPAWVDDARAAANRRAIRPHGTLHAAPVSNAGGAERLLGVAAMPAVACGVEGGQACASWWCPSSCRWTG
jgi:hypothetical protein